MKEMVGGCCVCSDERGWPDNPLVYCDGNGCTVAVHQACYGIVTVPTGPWYCRKCENPDTKGKVRCELCPSKSGALKRSDTGGWAHVVCALYIPEVRFGNVTSMEPIVLRLIPAERYNKTCYICQEQGKSHRASAGACMQCNKSGCKQQFHVTCAQSLGLLCEEAGNYLDNVKYCGYCQHHYSKLKKGGNVKTIPPYKPVSHDSQSSDSSGEKEGDHSPKTGGSTPTHKSKGSGRKSSHTSGTSSGKNTPNASKTPTTQSNMDKSRKSSPSRRGSATGDAGSAGGSKASTPAPSPQHNTDAAAPHAGKGVPESKVAPPASSPGAKSSESSVINAAPAPNTAASAAGSVMSTSVVQSTGAKSSPYSQESVITNATDSIENKHTKKRKAATAANSAANPGDYASHQSPSLLGDSASGKWDNTGLGDASADGDKIVKKAKTDNLDSMSQYANPPLPPPPAASPASQPSPRHLPSPMPGPSGLSAVPNIRSPSQPPPMPAGHNDNRGPSPLIFHQVQKQAAMEPAHSPHGVGARSSWGGLNVSYEMQQPTHTAVGPPSGGASKDPSLANPGGVRNKKRAAMATSVVSMANTPPAIQSPGAQSLSNVRRPPQPTPPPIYQETIKDSPPSSPSSERPLKPKVETNRQAGSCTAPHMLGNELNPESGAAARLQEQLSAELAAHAAGQAPHPALVPPPLINKAGQSGGAGSSRGGSAQSLDQLLERQWEQGSQFLMEQAQHFDIASLLSCLHQLRTENVRLEEHVGNLLQRRDHLLAVNARLAIPLTAVSTGSAEQARCGRENGGQMRAPPPAVRDSLPAERPHQLMVRDVQQKPS